MDDFLMISAGNEMVVQLLLRYGASLSQTDEYGFCAIMPCLSNGLSIKLLRYIVDLMDKQGVQYDISRWDYLIKAFPWKK